MKIVKQLILDLTAAYSTVELKLRGKRYLAVASENIGYHAYIIDPDTLNYSLLWEGESGVMNIVQVPGQERLLCITKFFPIFQSKETTICVLEPTDQGILSPWKITEVLKLPYCHRIGIIQSQGEFFIVGCTLCQDKDSQDDWTKPGAVWASPIPNKVTGIWKFSKVFEGLTKNHGLYIENLDQVYVTSENGVMHFDFSTYNQGDTIFPVLLTTKPTSDISLMRDGPHQIMGTIEPFHGDLLKLYKVTGHAIEEIRSYSIHFGHVVWVGKVFGRNAVIVASRGAEKELLLIYWESDETIVIDEGAGATQLCVYQENDTTKIFSANHGAGAVVLYTLSKDQDI